MFETHQFPTGTYVPNFDDRFCRTGNEISGIIRHIIKTNSIAWLPRVSRSDRCQWSLIAAGSSIEKVCGSYEALSNDEKFTIVNKITETYLWGFAQREQLTDNDKCNLVDLIVIACELLYTVNIYD